MRTQKIAVFTWELDDIAVGRMWMVLGPNARRMLRENLDPETGYLWGYKFEEIRDRGDDNDFILRDVKGYQVLMREETYIHDD